MRDLTLEDVAQLAGVSRSTVSRVINTHPNVSENVRKRVMKVIQNTGYHPNAAARSLASQRSWMIGLVLPRTTSSFFTDPYFPHLTQGIAFACNNNNFTLSLFLVGNREDEEKITPRITRRGMLDGMLIQSGPADDKLTERLISSPVPCVVLGRPQIQGRVSYVDVDNVNAARMATEHLIKLGHKQIAMITGAGNTAVSSDRCQGFFRALTEAGHQTSNELISEGDFSEISGYRAMKKILPHKPDAVFAQSDIMAVGAIRAIQEAGLSVPEDISIVGFDDIPTASLTKVRLTTIHQPITRFGIKAVELLIDLIEHGVEPVRRLILETELIVRGSSQAREEKGS